MKRTDAPNSSSSSSTRNLAQPGSSTVRNARTRRAPMRYGHQQTNSSSSGNPHTGRGRTFQRAVLPHRRRRTVNVPIIRGENADSEMEAEVPGVNVNVEIPVESESDNENEEVLRSRVEMEIFKHPISDELYEEWCKQVFGPGGPGFFNF
jgi:hypothetical protein